MCPANILQIILLSLILKVKLSEEIILRPTTVKVIENHSVNITCTVESNSTYVIFNIGDHESTIVLNSCYGEGDIVTDQSKFGLFCPNNDSVIVTLKSVQRASHLKTMMCKTLVNNSINLSNNVTIYVTVPITNVTLHQTSTIIKTSETRETVIECITSAGYPTSSIHWYKNESRLLPSLSNIDTTHTNTDSYLMTTSSTLRMYPGREDNSSSLFCTANNTELRLLYSDNVTLLVYYGPDKPTLSIGTYTIHDTVNIISGHSLKIQCNSKSYPTPQYSWLTPNHSIIRGHILNVPEVTYPGSNGIYKCHVNVSMELSTGTEYSTNETSVHVSVMYPPKIPYFLYNNDPSSTVHNITLQVVGGDNFTVRCVSDSVPEPKYSWTGHENNDYITRGNKSSDLKITSIHNDVVLTCTATNVMKETPHGTTLTQSANSSLNISVLYPPKKPEFYITNMVVNVLEQKDNIDVVEGDTVVITCHADSRPKPDGYFWSSKPSINNATLEIKDINPTQEGTYSCKAHNTMRRTFGQQKEGTNENEIIINILCKPRPPSMFKNIDFLVTNSTITLSWKSGFHCRDEQVFILKYQEVNTDDIWTTLYVKDSGEKELTTTLTSLASGTVYGITIAAKNEVGESSVSNPLFVSTQGRRQTKQNVVQDSYDSCNNSIIIVGASMGGVLVLFGVIVGLCVYRKYYSVNNYTKQINQPVTVQPSHTTYDEVCARGEVGEPYEEIRMSRLVKGGENEIEQVENKNKLDMYENLKI